MVPCEQLAAGEVGYVISNIKSLATSSSATRS
jgi:translation elongation factor EF-4